METSSNRFPTPGEELTLEKLLEAQKKLEELLPEFLYKLIDYLPRLGPEGEPYVLGFYETGESLSIWKSPPYTGRKVHLFHSDNLEEIRRRARGRVRLVEWLPGEKEEDGKESSNGGSPEAS